MNITEPIRRVARLTPDTVAIVRADGGTITHAELDRAIDRMIGYAARLGILAGDVCGLTIAPPDEAPALILALALARMGVASADPALPIERMRLCFEQRRDGRPGLPGRVTFDASWMTGPAVETVSIDDRDEACCRIFASSGTTGAPKFIPVSHELMSRRVMARLVALPGGPATNLIAIGLGGSWGFVAALRSLWLGGTIVLFDPPDAVAAIRRHEVTAISASTAALRSILDMVPAGGASFPLLHSIEVGGSTVPVPLYTTSGTGLMP